jgi:RimJ/RimL family protein N-acetyltransferase
VVTKSQGARYSHSEFGAIDRCYDGLTVGPDILSERLRINDLTPDDAPALFHYRSHPDVARFQSWLPESVDAVRAFIARNTATAFGQNDSWYQLAVRSASTGQLIGDLGVHFMKDGHQVEIGFTIAPAHQRQRFGTLAVETLLQYLFTVMQKHRVFASVDPRNEPSLALLTRVGMREEAHFRQSLFWKGEWMDDVIFARLRSEWAV